jgi:small subunit ribosomal protein S6
MNVECGAETLAELESIFRFNDAVIRSVTIRCDDAITEPSPLKKESEGKPVRRMREEEPADDDYASDDE